MDRRAGSSARDGQGDRRSQLIQRGIDLEQKKAALPKYHDLDALAGTWSEQEAAEFDRTTASIRRALWC